MKLFSVGGSPCGHRGSKMEVIIDILKYSMLFVAWFAICYVVMLWFAKNLPPME